MEPFSRTFQVRWSEMNAHRHLDIAGYLRYVIETAWAWGEAGGLSHADSAAMGIAWILREYELTLFRPVTVGERLSLSIWLWQWRRVRGTRCFEIHTEAGELVGHGAQQIVVLDSESLRPRRLPAEQLAAFMSDDPRRVPHQPFPKFPPRPVAAFTMSHQVDWGDLDWLQHVNNANYAVFAENSVRAALATVGWGPARLFAEGMAPVADHFHIQYQAPAFWGERLSINAYLTHLGANGGTWYVDMSRAEDGATICQCVLVWSLRQTESGEVRPLPSTLHAGLQTQYLVD